MTRARRDRALTLRPHEVRAVLAGATRHWVPVRPQPDPEMPIEAWRQDGNGHWYGVSRLERTGGVGVPETEMLRAPLDVGDRAWVREAFTHITGNGIRVHYRADGEPTDQDGRVLPTHSGRRRWSPPTHMPRWASRLLLEVTAVSVARIQDVTEEDARAMRLDDMDGLLDAAEICRFAKLIGCSYEDCRPSVAAAWDVLHGRGAWDRNDWCWARTFRRVEGP